MSFSTFCMKKLNAFKYVIYHRLVVDGHYLLGDSLGQLIETSGTATCKNNSFHISVLFR